MKNALKIMAVGDIHAKSSNVKEQTILRSELDRIAEEEKPNKIVLLGDLLNDFSQTHVLALREIDRTVQALTRHVKVDIVVGNHDMENSSLFLSDHHFLHFFKSWPDVSVFDSPKALETSMGTLIFCPYVPPGRFVEALDLVDGWKEARAIFGHQEFRGVRMGGRQSEYGDYWAPDWPMVITGHIHESQWVGNNVYNAGSSLYDTFGDTSPRKHVAIIEISKDELKIREVELKVPKKITLKVKMADVSGLELEKGHQYRLNISATVEEYAIFKKSKKYKQLNELCKIIPDITNTEIIRKNIEQKGYVELLRERATKESVDVLGALEEILRQES